MNQHGLTTRTVVRCQSECSVQSRRVPTAGVCPCPHTHARMPLLGLTHHLHGLQVREALADFHASNYTSCLNHLEKLR